MIFDFMKIIKNNRSYVGMIIFSATMKTENDVKAFYGGNKWQRIQGRFILGATTIATYSEGDTGGKSTHVLTAEEVGAHEHEIVTEGIPKEGLYRGAGTEGGSSWTSGTITNATTYSNQKLKAKSTRTENAAHNNMPPYICEYIWKRVE